MKLILATFISSLFFTPTKTTMEKWVIEKNSNLCIEGRSNVNTFRCDVIEYLHPDTVCFYKDDQQQQLNIKGGLSISVQGFDCHQRFMTGDLRKTLKATDYPFLKIDLLSIGNFSKGISKTTTGWVSIVLAGITKKIDINYTIQTSPDGHLHLLGSQQVLFSDFNLTPPRKLAGLIKVEEQINIKFQLILRQLPVAMAGK